MRVLLQTDMEGVSHITSLHEVFPVWDEYWETGRRRLTEDVIAAVLGLLDGGATEVIVDDQHLDGPSNIIVEDLPNRASVPGPAAIYQQLQDRAFDAVFQVGRHPRWGTNDGFVSHTQVPGVSIALDDQLLTESHICAVRAAVPVLGIIGDDKLDAQIDGILSGTPFLAVKCSRGLTNTRPRHQSTRQSRATIRDFAESCIKTWRSRSAAALPQSFTLSAFVGDTNLARQLSGNHGFTLVGDSVVSVRCDDWWRDAEPAMQAATGAVAAPLIEALGTLDMSSLSAIHDADQETLEASRNVITASLTRPQRAWCD